VNVSEIGKQWYSTAPDLITITENITYAKVHEWWHVRKQNVCNKQIFSTKCSSKISETSVGEML